MLHRKPAQTFIGRSPSSNQRGRRIQPGKAVLKAIDFGLDDILEGFLRQLDLLDWSTTIAKVEGETSTSMPANYPVFALEIP